MIVEDYLNDLRMFYGFGGLLFFAGLIIRHEALLLIGLWFLGFTYTVEFHTKNALKTNILE